jgi:hypothetical protein
MTDEELDNEEFTHEDLNIVKKTQDAFSINKLKTRDPRKLRNLHQYKGLSEEEFDEKMAELKVGVTSVQEFEKRIQKKLKEFSEDYDLTELNSNDKLVLRALCQAHITLEDLERQSYKLREEGIGLDNITIIEKVSKVMSDLRKDISNLQDDLKITRKVRKSDKETSVINYIDDLKAKAKEFYSSRMSYIYCECGMLLSTIWTLYPEANNKITLVCQRELENGEKCGKKVTITTKELLEKRGTNHPEVMPESLL